MPPSVPPKPPNSAQVDPQLESLLEQSRPIIAEERGLNQRSRVKIQAIGKKLNMPAGIIDQAIQILHGAPPVQGIEESKYEQSFADVMREKIAAIPGGILTTRIEEKAISVGMRKYQLSETQSRRIVRRVAEEVNIPRVTLNEAERHLEQEIAELLGEETWITGEQKLRLVKNGKRLGIKQAQISAMIQRHLQFNFQQVRNERKLADRLWVIAAVVVVGLFFALFVYTQLGEARKEKAEVDKKDQSDSKSKPITTESKLPDWWDDDLKVLLQKTRLRVKGFSNLHDQIKSSKPTIRADAYRKLLRLDEGKLNSQAVRDRVGLTLPSLFFADPDPIATKGMITGFTDSIKIPDGNIPDGPNFFNKAFWSLAMLNSIIGNEKLEDAKVNAIQDSMVDVCGRKFDLFLSEDARLQKQKRALFEKYFVHMIDVGPAFPTKSPDTIATLSNLAKTDLNEDKIQDLRYGFVVSFLRYDDNNWMQCGALIEEAILEATVPQLSFFIDWMESSKIEKLQFYLQHQLFRKAAFGGDPGTIAESAQQFREYFELDADSTNQPITPMRELVDDAIIRFSNRWLLKPTALSNNELAQIWAEATYLTTLIVAEKSSDPELADELIEIGFPDLNSRTYAQDLTGENSAGDDDTSSESTTNDSSGDASERDARKRLQDSLLLLNQYKILQSSRRRIVMQSIGRVAKSVRSINGAQANVLARYLLTRKNDPESEIANEAILNMRHWHALIVAIADQLLIDNYPRETVLDVCSLLLNQDLMFEGVGWPTKLSEYLLKESQSRISFGMAKTQRVSPLHSLKKLLGYFYALRANAQGIATATIVADDVETILRRTIEHYKLELSNKKNSDVLAAIDLKLNIVNALGNDPLTRIMLQLEIIVDCLRQIHTSKTKPPEPSEAILKLERLLESRINHYPTVIGQIVEIEVMLLILLHGQASQ